MMILFAFGWSVGIGEVTTLFAVAQFQSVEMFRGQSWLGKTSIVRRALYFFDIHTCLCTHQRHQLINIHYHICIAKFGLGSLNTYKYVREYAKRHICVSLRDTIETLRQPSMSRSHRLPYIISAQSTDLWMVLVERTLSAKQREKKWRNTKIVISSLLQPTVNWTVKCGISHIRHRCHWNAFSWY